MTGGQTIAWIAAGGFVVIAAFQVALAAGAPLGAAAWGGAHPGRLPAKLRAGSAVAAGIWTLAALVVLGRAGSAIVSLPAGVTRWGTWLLVGVLPVGALMNFASSSPWERWVWGPFALVLAGLCFAVARMAFPAPAG